MTQMEGAPSPNNGDSACSTPFVSAPSSPTHRCTFPTTTSGFFFSAPASPSRNGDLSFNHDLNLDFDFSSRFLPAQAAEAGAMTSADELFHNGQIRPTKLSSLLLHPQALPPLGEADMEGPPADTERGRDLRLRSRSVHRKSRSLSPLRNPFHCQETRNSSGPDPDPDTSAKQNPESEPSGPSVPGAASRSSSSSSTSSSSSSRSSRRWFSLKQLLNRSKSDNGNDTTKEKETETTKIRHLFSFVHEKPKAKPNTSSSGTGTTNTLPSPSPASRQRQSRAPARRRTAAERMYEARRAEAEEMRRRTALPYRQGHGLLLGCLGFGAGGGAIRGLARGLNVVNATAAAAASRS